MQENLANPAPLGLMGFGMTTVLLNIHNAGFFSISAMVLSMGFFTGGLPRLSPACLSTKKGNTFGLVAFLSFGHFWLTLVGLLVLPKTGLAEATPPRLHGLVSLHVGAFYIFYVYCHLKEEPRSSDDLSHTYHPFLAAGGEGLDRQRRYRHHRRI